MTKSELSVFQAFTNIEQTESFQEIDYIDIIIVITKNFEEFVDMDKKERNKRIRV
jgi:hypothetical protein